MRVALAMYAYNGWSATSLPWENLVALGRPLLGKPIQYVGEEAAPDGPGSIILEEGQLYVRVNEELVPVDEYQRFDAMGDREEWLEDQEYTEEGQLALLQAQLVLGLHITVLRTCGLSIYRTLTALWQGQAERGAVPDTDGVPAAGDGCSGVRRNLASECLRRDAERRGLAVPSEAPARTGASILPDPLAAGGTRHLLCRGRIPAFGSELRLSFCQPDRAGAG